MKLNLKEWEKINDEMLLENYYYYLKDTVLDGTFNLKTTQDYWAFVKEEYNFEKERIANKEEKIYS